MDAIQTDLVYMIIKVIQTTTFQISKWFQTSCSREDTIFQYIFISIPCLWLSDIWRKIYTSTTKYFSAVSFCFGSLLFPKRWKTDYHYGDESKRWQKKRIVVMCLCFTYLYCTTKVAQYVTFLLWGKEEDFLLSKGWRYALLRCTYSQVLNERQ